MSGTLQRVIVLMRGAQTYPFYNLAGINWEQPSLIKDEMRGDITAKGLESAYQEGSYYFQKYQQPLDIQDRKAMKINVFSNNISRTINTANTFLRGFRGNEWLGSIDKNENFFHHDYFFTFDYMRDFFFNSYFLPSLTNINEIFSEKCKKIFQSNKSEIDNLYNLIENLDKDILNLKIIPTGYNKLQKLYFVYDFLNYLKVESKLNQYKELEEIYKRLTNPITLNIYVKLLETMFHDPSFIKVSNLAFFYLLNKLLRNDLGKIFHSDRSDKFILISCHGSNLISTILGINLNLLKNRIPDYCDSFAIELYENKYCKFSYKNALEKNDSGKGLDDPLFLDKFGSLVDENEKILINNEKIEKNGKIYLNSSETKKINHFLEHSDKILMKKPEELTEGRMIKLSDIFRPNATE